MNVSIDVNALRTLFYGILSCQCPVTRNTEHQISRIYKAVTGRRHTDYLSVLEISDKNPGRTPFHNLFDFCTWSKETPDKFIITRNDVLRFLGSSFHCNMVTANNPGMEKTNPALLISHVLTPVTLKSDNREPYASYSNGKKEVVFKPVALPADIQRKGRFHEKPVPKFRRQHFIFIDLINSNQYKNRV